MLVNKANMQYNNRENMIKALKQARNNLIFAASQKIKLNKKEISLLIRLDYFLSEDL